MEEGLQQRRRARIAQRFLSGAWGVELESFEADQERERQRDQEIVLGRACRWIGRTVLIAEVHAGAQLLAIRIGELAAANTQLVVGDPRGQGRSWGLPAPLGAWWGPMPSRSAAP